MSRIRVVLVEDDETLNRVLTKELTEAGFEVQAFQSAEGVVEGLYGFAAQVALLDMKLPGKSGLELLADLRSGFPDLQVVMLTGHGGIPEAVEAMSLGACDFLTKPTRLEVLEKTLRNAAEKSELLIENARLKRAAASHPEPFEIIGSSEAMREVQRLIARIAPTDESVLIEGENGTGKELIARNLHRLSSRAERPMVIVNCAAIPDNLVESEMFGHEKGAFTGAERKKIGLFEAADGGTLFLDEVGELPLQIQPVLLRVLQFGEIRPVGGSGTRQVDVRVLAATNRDLEIAIEAGDFRQDLFYRLATFQIEVPPLRSRRDDIAELAEAFLDAAAAKTDRDLAFDDDAIRLLSRKPWAGNARELQNAITRLSVLAAGPTITGGDVERLGFGAAVPVAGNLPSLQLAELEQMAIQEALERHSGNRAEAAEDLGISVRTLYNKLKRLDLSDPEP